MNVPRGHGIYARALPDSYLERFDFVAFSAARGDVRADAEAAVRRGQPHWLFSDPADWTPTRWRATLDRLEPIARATRAQGIIIDLENGWRGASEEEAREVAEEIARRATPLNPIAYGITTVPLMRWRHLWGRILRGKAWVSPQLYPEALAVTGPVPLPALAGFYRDFQSTWGPDSVVPSVRIWRGEPFSPWVETPASYAAYIAALPTAPGFIGWPTNTPPEWMTLSFLNSATVKIGAATMLLLLVGAAFLAWYFLGRVA